MVLLHGGGFDGPRLVGAGVARQPRRRLLRRGRRRRSAPDLRRLRRAWQDDRPLTGRHSCSAPGSTVRIRKMAARTGGATRWNERPRTRNRSRTSERDPREPDAAGRGSAELTLTPPARWPRSPGRPRAGADRHGGGARARRQGRRVRRRHRRRSTCTPRRSRPRPATSPRWATTTSAPRPRRRTASSSSPVRAMKQGPLSQGAKVAATLLDLRRTIEDLDPEAGDRHQEAARHDPVRRQDPRLLPQVRERAVPPRRHHQGALRRPGRAAQGQRRARAGEGASLGDDAAARAVHLHREAARRRARARGSRRSRSPTRRRPRRSATTCCSTRARSTRTCSPSRPSRSRATWRSTSSARTTSS